MLQNTNDLSQNAEYRYRKSILSLLGRLRDLRPLPAHLDYMVQVVGRLSSRPVLVLGIIPNAPGMTGEDMLAYVEAPLPMQVDIPDGVRWLEAQVEYHGLDVREQLTSEELRPTKKPSD